MSRANRFVDCRLANRFAHREQTGSESAERCVGRSMMINVAQFHAVHRHGGYHHTRTTSKSNSGSLNQCVLLFVQFSKRETFCVRSHTVKSIWKCRPQCGRHFDVGFINQALLAKVSLLDKVSFCGRVKSQSRPGNPTDKMKKMSIMANPIMSGGILVFLTTAHNRAMSSHVQNRLSTDTYVTQRPNLLRENGYVV